MLYLESNIMNIYLKFMEDFKGQIEEKYKREISEKNHKIRKLELELQLMHDRYDELKRCTKM